VNALVQLLITDLVQGPCFKLLTFLMLHQNLVLLPIIRLQGSEIQQHVGGFGNDLHLTGAASWCAWPEAQTLEDSSPTGAWRS